MVCEKPDFDVSLTRSTIISSDESEQLALDREGCHAMVEDETESTASWTEDGE